MARTPDVAPGALIESAWGNEIRDRTIQVFATEAEMQAWAAPNGSYAAVAFGTDPTDFVLWERRLNAWLGPQMWGVTVRGTVGVIDGNQRGIVSILSDAPDRLWNTAQVLAMGEGGNGARLSLANPDPGGTGITAGMELGVFASSSAMYMLDGPLGTTIGIVDVIPASSRAIKVNINPLPPVLAKLLPLEVVTYQRKGNEVTGEPPGRVQAGLVIEDVEPVFPELVIHDPVAEYPLLDTASLPFFLLEALQEITTRLEAAEATIATLMAGQ
jgi:hypothetical protein